MVNMRHEVFKSVIKAQGFPLFILLSTFVVFVKQKTWPSFFFKVKIIEDNLNNQGISVQESLAIHIRKQICPGSFFLFNTIMWIWDPSGSW